MPSPPAHDRDSALFALRGLPASLWKTRGWLALLAAGIPSVAGVATPDWDVGAARAVAAFARARGLDAVLLRSEPRDGGPTSVRGGFLVPLDDLDAAGRRAADAGHSTFWLEPLSPYDDVYSLNGAFWSDGTTDWEVVGPGFDASDIKRGDLDPHERSTYLPGDVPPHHETHWTVAPDAYLASYRQRVDKVATRLRTSPGLVAQALAEDGHPLLRGAAAGYAPLPSGMLVNAHQDLLILVASLDGLGLPPPPVVLSLSYVAEGEGRRRVGWDAVWPENKYVLD